MRGSFEQITHLRNQFGCFFWVQGRRIEQQCLTSVTVEKFIWKQAQRSRSLHHLFHFIRGGISIAALFVSDTNVTRVWSYILKEGRSVLTCDFNMADPGIPWYTAKMDGERGSHVPPPIKETGDSETSLSVTNPESEGMFSHFMSYKTLRSWHPVYKRTPVFQCVLMVIKKLFPYQIMNYRIGFKRIAVWNMFSYDEFDLEKLYCRHYKISSFTRSILILSRAVHLIKFLRPSPSLVITSCHDIHSYSARE